jgi:hypothetical protein
VDGPIRLLNAPSLNGKRLLVPFCTGCWDELRDRRAYKVMGLHKQQQFVLICSSRRITWTRPTGGLHRIRLIVWFGLRIWPDMI